MRLGHDEAVSPVMGVIMLVAITFCVAAVIFVFANGLEKKTERLPYVVWDEDEGHNVLLVIQVKDWPLILTDIDVSDQDGDDDCQWFDVTGAAMSGTVEIGPGDYLDCSALDVESEITIRHMPTEAVLRKLHFSP